MKAAIYLYFLVLNIFSTTTHVIPYGTYLFHITASFTFHFQSIPRKLQVQVASLTA